MFQLFKSEEEKTKELEKLEALIDTENYQLVQGKDGRWSYKEQFCGDWLLMCHRMFKNKNEVIGYILNLQQEEAQRTIEKANFN